MSTFFEQLARLSPDKRALLERRLAEQGFLSALPERIAPRPPGSPSPLSFAQHRLWFVQQLDPDSTAYNVSTVLALDGTLDAAAMQRSLHALVERHEVLRTRFVGDAQGQPQQMVDAVPDDLLPLQDLSGAADAEAAARARVAALTRPPFDLARVPLRCALIKVAATRHLLVLATHHIVCDRWSVGVFLRELATLYRAACRKEPSPLAPLAIQYADWAAWQRDTLDGAELQKLSDYWMRQLGAGSDNESGKALPLLDLPYDRPQPRIADDAGAWHALALPAGLSDALRALAQHRQTTLFALLLAAFNILLARYADSEDIVVGSDIANRERPETADMIGLLVNTLVLRNDLSGNPRFGELLARVRQTVLDALAHQAMPFEKLVELLNPERRADQLMPLFQAKFDLQLANVKPVTLDGLTLSRETPPDERTKYLLRMNLQDTPEGICGQIEYSRALFDASTIARMARHFGNLLAAIVAAPDAPIRELPLIDADERRALLIALNDSARDHAPIASMHALIAAQVARTPDAIAVSAADGSGALSYRELDARADALAARLRALGARTDQPVGVCMPRTPRLLVALLAVLKSGACYVPLDPDYPAERLALIAADAGLDLLLVDAQAQATLPLSVDGVACIAVDDAPAPATTTALPDAAAGDLAYVIYTSGSTGRPKGVAIEHRSAVAMLQWGLSAFTADELAGTLAATSICFDLSVFELFLPLCCGGRVILVDNALALAGLDRGCGITLVNTVPSVLNRVLNTGGIPDSVRVVNLAGEPLPPALLERLRDLGHVRRACNLYGPSEDTTYSTWTSVDLTRPLPPMVRVPIGRPIDNTQAYVVDGMNQPVPPGVPGELLLGGAGLARGYLGRPELTAASFVPNPFVADGAPSARVYRTGDRVRLRADGQLEFLGRRDDQVKIRGYRIETGEVDDALRRHPAVRDVVVSAQRVAGDLQLVAHVETDAPVAALRDHLAQRLPHWMVPTQFLIMSALPRLPNGKVNRHALPTVDAVDHAPVALAPRSPLEATLAALWQDVLGRPVGVSDSFFELGGHSLLAMELVVRCERALGRSVPLRALFASPTVAGLADWLNEHAPDALHGGARSALQPDPARRFEPFPLTDIQQAYLIGRNAAFELGNVATHGYREIEVSGVDVAAVERVLNALVERHDMLRMIVVDTTQQRVLPEVPAVTVARHDLRALESGTRREALAATRERLSHQMFDPRRWPLFQIDASLLPDDRVRFHVSFDVLIGDAWSFQLLGRELAQGLLGLTPEPLALAFRDVMLAEQAQRQTAVHARAEQYWRDRLDTLPPAPELPLTMAPSQVRTPRFTRRGSRLPATAWSALQAQARRHGLTPSTTVLAAFADALAELARQPAFTLNLTLFNRPALHADVKRLVGDFTASLLLQVAPRPGMPFAARAHALQAQLWADLEHRSVSGVQVQRELARKLGRGGGALMPVVFTSTLGQSARPSGDARWQAEVVHAVSQTSQVYLDHQVSEVDGALQVNWDTIDALFPPAMLDHLVARHAARLQALASDDAAWTTQAADVSAGDWLPAFNTVPSALRPDGRTRLHTLFFDAARRHADRAAVVTPTRTLSYGDLADEVRALAARLHEQGVSAQDLVAVSIAKGWQQVVAVLAVLAAGGAYVPIDTGLPRARRDELVADTGARVLLVAEGCTLEWSGESSTGAVVRLAVAAHPTGVRLADEDIAGGEDGALAYVIYTSGSTGMPKGVMIDHRGAVNTVLDINARHAVGPDDRVFGLSALNFDLSVWDIFGTLAAGAALVLPAADSLQQPHRWREQLRRERVTIWNSVPALAQLLADAADPDIGDATLRLVMMSGDWIPLALPAALRSHFPQARLVSMGGATEASIWSIDHPIGDVDPDWRSIPYGRPLANQQWYVLDERMQPRPPGVPGRLWIGGIGVARGYWRRPELSAQRFVPNPLPLSLAGLPDDADDVLRRGASLLYDTGDMGLYRADGTLEFLGREDHQVKLNGYRVELGEIESVLQQHPSIAAAAVAVHGRPPSLTAYIVPALPSAGDGTADGENLHSPLDRLDFKQQHRGWPASTGDAGIALAGGDDAAAAICRQSHRRFSARRIAFADFGRWLSALRAHTVTGAPLPKLRYPSAGTTYPVQAWLEVKADRIEGLAAGWYVYHPGEHRLLPVAAPASDAAHYGPNRAVHEGSAFGLFLIARRSAIEPLYGERARDLALIEAGHIAQLLMEEASLADLGLTPVAGRGLPDVAALLDLDDDHLPLYGLLGGAVDTDWHARWQALDRPAAGSATLDQALTGWLRERLPAYMVPARIQLMAALPLSANGKVDRKALPEPGTGGARQHVAPRSELEAGIVALWQELLAVDRVSVDDDFFALGGHSLIAMQLMARLRERYAVDLTLARMLGALTPATQAALIAGLQAAAPAHEGRDDERIERADELSALDGLSDDAVDALLADMMAAQDRPA
ncbi:non-ribosomal peptide synthetase [Methyloversatilis thermotolerans]|uniref:non-ribosomal peptide synthetase n=1 Tax=Methyloversatilis thermotolerans TaxID=1346290 RepID=UPI0003715146|nr:non-ribosomal peptide synthetase [Methyloversatilis thermotolerans]